MEFFMVTQPVTILPVHRAPTYKYVHDASSIKEVEQTLGAYNGNALNIAQNTELPQVVSPRGSLFYYETLHPVTVCPEAFFMYDWHQRPHTGPHLPHNSLDQASYNHQRCNSEPMDVAWYAQNLGLTLQSYTPPAERKITRGQMQQKRVPRMKQTPPRSVMESLPSDLLSPDYTDPDVSMMIASMDYFYNVSTYGITNMAASNTSSDPM